MTEAVSLIRPSPFSARQMFELVRDIDSYSAFVPYCTASRVISVDEQGGGRSLMTAELRVAYRMLGESWKSEIILNEGDLSLRVGQAQGPFRRLDNRWFFADAPDGSDIHFYLDFEFRVPLLRKIVQPMMGRAVEKFVSAFEKRALDIYG